MRFTSIISGFVFCTLVVASSGAFAQDLKQQFGFSEDFLRQWRDDRNGCKGDRCFLKDSLVSNKSIIGISKKSFLLLFGKPDKYGSNKQSLIYFVCTKCDKREKPLKTYDSSWLVCMFENGKLVEVVEMIQ